MTQPFTAASIASTLQADRISSSALDPPLRNEQELQACSSGKLPKSSFNMGQLSSRISITDVALDNDFIASAGTTAIDLCDEDDGQGLKIAFRLQELNTSQGASGGRELGSRDGESMSVNVVDEIVRGC